MLKCVLKGMVVWDTQVPVVYHQPQLPSSPPSLRTFLVAAATAVTPSLMAEGNGTPIIFFLSMLSITSWSCFSFVCPSYSSVWILVNYGRSKKDLVPCHVWCCTYRLQWGHGRTYYLKKWGTTSLQRKSAKKMDVKCSQLSWAVPSWGR